MKDILIPLTQGRFAIVSPEDARLVAAHKWYAHFNKGAFYALRKYRKTDHTQGVISMARMILGLESNDPRVADHINGNTLDNRRENLRPATVQQNCINRTARSFVGSSRRTGDSKWRSRIRVGGKQITIGWFATQEEAHEAYCLAAAKYHESFSKVSILADKTRGMKLAAERGE